jgi:glucan phosphorylase
LNLLKILSLIIDIVHAAITLYREQKIKSKVAEEINSVTAESIDEAKTKADNVGNRQLTDADVKRMQKYKRTD